MRTIVKSKSLQLARIHVADEWDVFGRCDPAIQLAVFCDRIGGVIVFGAVDICCTGDGE